MAPTSTGSPRAETGAEIPRRLQELTKLTTPNGRRGRSHRRESPRIRPRPCGPMLSHAIPSTDRACAQSPSVEMRLANARLRAEGPRGGSISVALHPSLRRQGANLDLVGVPAGAGEGWLRRGLRLSVARRAGARLRRPRAHRRDRRAASDDAALFARPRRVRDRASRHERDFAPRRGGPGFFRGAAEDGVGARRRGGVRRPRAQIPDLGAGPLSNASRTGAARVRRLRAEREALASDETPR